MARRRSTPLKGTPGGCELEVKPGGTLCVVNRRRFGRACGGLAVAVALALSGATGAASSPQSVLHYSVVLPGEWEVGQCGEGSTVARCFLVELHGLIPGLGRVVVHEDVRQSGDMDLLGCEPQIRLGEIVAARGTIEYVGDGIDCPGTQELNGGYRAVVVVTEITGGTGLYAGASGTGHGSVRPDEEEVFIHLAATVDLPSVSSFDLTPPRIATPRTITVRSAKPTVVRYRPLTALDAVDGPVPVTCVPASGWRFPLGRTLVRCEAFDDSGNAARANFSVVVKRKGS